MTMNNLETAAVGRPVTRLGVSFFPLYLAGNDLPAISTGEASGLAVDELDEASVPTLRVRNPGDKPVLVVEGEHFLGGKQNRAVNATVLVPALADLEIPVSCLERGRWGRRRTVRRDDVFTAPRVRAVKDAGVARSIMRGAGARDGDQGAVWSAVDDLLDRADLQSDTAAAADVKRAARWREPSRAAAIEQLAAGGPLPGQCGIVVAHGRRVTAMDLFGAPHLLVAHWGALIRSHLLEPAAAAAGKPSATQVLDAVRSFASAPATETPGVGLGVDRRVAGERLAGHALTLNGATVHAAFFTAPDDDTAGSPRSRPRRPRSSSQAADPSEPQRRTESTPTGDPRTGDERRNGRRTADEGAARRSPGPATGSAGSGSRVAARGEPSGPAPQMRDRARGLMVGIAAGNLLGIVQEGWSRERVDAEFPGGVREIAAVPGFPDDDDMAQAIVVAEAAAAGSLDPADLGRRFWTWAEVNGAGMGGLTGDVLTRYGGRRPQCLARNRRTGSAREPAGAPIEQASRAAWSGGRAGNGAAMRCAPLAIRWCGEPAALVRNAVLSAVPTHWDRRCGWSCALLNLAAAAALRGESMTADELLAVGLDGVRVALPELEPFGYEARVPERVRAAVQQAWEADLDDLEVDGASSGYTLLALQVGLSAYWRAPDFEQGLRRVVEAGGDTDTNGAVVGALLGARFGVDAVPVRWRRRVAEIRVGRTPMEAYAERLLAARG